MTTLFILMVLGAFIVLAIEQGTKELKAEIDSGTPQHRRVVGGRFVFYVVMAMYAIILLMHIWGKL